LPFRIVYTASSDPSELNEFDSEFGPYQTTRTSDMSVSPDTGPDVCALDQPKPQSRVEPTN
jgi:hypothetical protein